MAVTRINNNQISDAVSGNVYVGINAAAKLQNYSITSQKISNNLNYGSDLTVSGNLVVQGNVTAIDTVDLVVEDPLILLAKDQAGSPSLDIGFIGVRGSEENIAFVWNEANAEFATVFTTSEITNTTVAISSYASLRINDLVASNANITGDIVFDGTIDGNISLTGNLVAGNVIANASVSAITISASGNMDANNISITNNIDTTTINASGNATVNNLNANLAITATDITASETISANNISVTSNFETATLETTGDAIIGGNLTVNGNLKYINVEDLRVEDPIILLGTGPNGNALVSNDGMDRGVYMEYYITGTGNAFVGWQNSSGNMLIANDVDFSGNNIIQVNSYGNLNVGNLYPETVNTGSGNIDGGNIIAASLVEGTTVTATANVNANNAVVINGISSATASVSGNMSGGNISITGTSDLGNLRIVGNDVTNSASNVITINEAGSDIDVRIEGDAQPNLFITDAGTDTVLINTGTAIANASLNVGGTAAIKVPVGTTGERPNPPTTGMVRFNTSINSLEFYDQDAWTTAGSEFTIIAYDDFLGDGACTTFTLSQESTTAGAIVTINGIVQIPITAYSITNDSLVFTEAPSVSDFIDVRMLTTTNEVRSISNATGNAVMSVTDTSDNVSITGDLVPVSNVAQDLGTSSLRWRDIYLSGNSITLGNIVIKNTGGNTIGFFGPDGTTPGSIDTDNIDSAAIRNGNSNVSVIASGGNVDVNIGGASIVTFWSGGINNRQSNGVGNIGTASSYFNTVFAKATSAQYADLAEMYEADQAIEPGTVVCFGGDKEITVCDSDMCTRVAGVISTNPSYLMNSTIEAKHAAAVALTGRVPVRVTGTVRKGDMMVSAGNGRARAESAPAIGSVIGKALENFDGTEGVIEVVVGRL